MPIQPDFAFSFRLHPLSFLPRLRRRPWLTRTSLLFSESLFTPESINTHHRVPALSLRSPVTMKTARVITRALLLHFHTAAQSVNASLFIACNPLISRVCTSLHVNKNFSRSCRSRRVVTDKLQIITVNVTTKIGATSLSLKNLRPFLQFHPFNEVTDNVTNNSPTPKHSFDSTQS